MQRLKKIAMTVASVTFIAWLLDLFKDTGIGWR
jgi:hypothetical protein